ncbi:MAG TPA: metalloregulator ArsR/SmtB family transcription factor [Gammaproteobacteria bacterium]|nr:metalloregulator ArsR/SmtB family transcription factor [Gammaproteobacteria bacterium]
MKAGAEQHDSQVSAIAAAIAEPARTRMLYCLMDGHARTSTELAAVAEVSPSTASVHLARLKEQRLVKVATQGKYRYYSLEGPGVAAALEALHVLAGTPPSRFVPNTPPRLRAARTCYDHMAGAVAVALHRRLLERSWLVDTASGDGNYVLTEDGTRAFTALGVDVAGARAQRRRFACACLDWSERQPHMAGSLAAALLKAALKRRWVVKDLDSRALRVTPIGRRELSRHFGLEMPS